LTVFLGNLSVAVTLMLFIKTPLRGFQLSILFESF
jgi:hypothetical protein